MLNEGPTYIRNEKIEYHIINKSTMGAKRLGAATLLSRLKIWRAVWKTDTWRMLDRHQYTVGVGGFGTSMDFAVVEFSCI